jgi:TRAP-type mannitol/chloroaromatic compound transport system permease small subunit
MPDASELPQPPLARALDRAVRSVGDAVSWIWVLLLLTIVANVTLRYVFGSGRIEFEELQWHLYSVGFLCGLSYCVESDSHVRVDVLRERFTTRTRAWIDLYGILLLLLPFVALVIVYGAPFAFEAFERSEVSQSPGGLPHRWAIKAMLPLGFALLGLSAISRLLRVGSVLFGADPPPERGR